MPNGKTKDLTVRSGEAIFEKPAVDAVRRWRFHPLVIEGQPVETVYRVELRFDPNLQEAIPSVALESPQPPDPPLPSMDPTSSTADGPVYRASPGSGVVSPKVVYQVDPEFSEEARKAKKDGYVRVRLVVGTDGLPHNLRLRCGAEAGLNEQALDAVEHWRFAPGTKDDKPVQVEIELEVEFKLFN